MLHTVIIVTCFVNSAICSGQTSPFYSLTGPLDNASFSGLYYNNHLFISQQQWQNYGIPGANPREELLKLDDNGLLVNSLRIDSLFKDGSLPVITQIKEKNDTLYLLINLKGKNVRKPYIIRTNDGFSFCQMDSIDFSTRFAKPFIQNFYFRDRFTVFYGYNDTINSTGTFWQLDGIGFVQDNSSNSTQVLYYPQMYFTGLHITDGGYMAQDISSSKMVYFNDTGAVERIKTYCIGGMFAEGSQVVDSLFFVFGTWCGNQFKAGFAVYEDSTLLYLNDSVPFFKPQMQITYHNFQFISANSIYLGITHMWPNNFALFPNPQWFSITKTDIYGNTKWQKTFGGDVNYILYGLVKGPDSSLFVLATRYDWTTQNNERDLYIYKIDKNGSMLSTLEYGALTPIEALVYPNPFTQQLELEVLSQNLKTVNVQLEDITGKTVLSQQLDLALQSKHGLQTGHLPAGVYIFTLTDGNGTALQRQKVIKR